MKHIALLGVALCLLGSSFCWAEYLNPFRRKIIVQFPDGYEAVVYKKSNIDDIFAKCQDRGACSKSDLYVIKCAHDSIKEGSVAAKKSILECYPECAKVVIEKSQALGIKNRLQHWGQGGGILMDDPVAPVQPAQSTNFLKKFGAVFGVLFVYVMHS